MFGGCEAFLLHQSQRRWGRMRRRFGCPCRRVPDSWPHKAHPVRRSRGTWRYHNLGLPGNWTKMSRDASKASEFVMVHGTIVMATVHILPLESGLRAGFQNCPWWRWSSFLILSRPRLFMDDTRWPCVISAWIILLANCCGSYGDMGLLSQSTAAFAAAHVPNAAADH